MLYRHSIVQGMTHRGLTGDDYREASFMCFYALASLCLRPLVAKVGCH